MSCPECGWPEPSGRCPCCGAFIRPTFHQDPEEEADGGQTPAPERCAFAAEEHFAHLADLAERRSRPAKPK